MTYDLKGALRSFTDEEIVLISSILNKAEQIERDTGRRPTHVGVHSGTLPKVGRLWDLVVVRSAELEPGTAYLMVCST